MTTAVILAAGAGTRLRPYTASRPKCLAEVAGKTILERALDSLRHSGIESVVVVVGYCAEQVMGAATTVAGHMRVRFAQNPAYSSTGTATSAKLGLHLAEDEEILLIEGDVVFGPEAVSRLQRVPAASPTSRTLAERYRAGFSGSAIELDTQGRVCKWHFNIPDDAWHINPDLWKTANLTLLTAADMVNTFRTSLDSALNRHGPRTSFEVALNDAICLDGMAIAGVDAAGLAWWEVDTPADLAMAERLFRDRDLSPSRA